MSELKASIKVDTRTGFTNYPVPFHPCRGCIYRNICDNTVFMNQGDYCRDKGLKMQSNSVEKIRKTKKKESNTVRHDKDQRKHRRIRRAMKDGTFYYQEAE